MSSTINYWQFHNGDFTDEKEIVVGIDFGTACTKVVIQDRILSKAFAVEFEIIPNNKTFLLPSTLYYISPKIVSLRKTDKKVSRLKMRFISTQKNDTKISEKNLNRWNDQELIASFFTLVFLEIRSWFNNNKKSDYRYVNIDWHLNIGIPALSYDSVSNEMDLKIAPLAAWNASLKKTKKKISLPEIKRAIKIANDQLNNGSVDENKGQIDPDNINIIPEAVAQIFGFRRSPQSYFGEFLLVDVGASTVDASTFILDKNNEDLSHAFLYTFLSPLGSLTLHIYRLKKIVEALNTCIGELNEKGRDNEAVPSENEYCSNFNNIDKELIIKEANNVFSTQCVDLLENLIRKSLNLKNILTSDWKNGCPIFLCGGGSNVKLYNDIFLQLEKRINPKGFTGFKFISLPKPDNLELSAYFDKNYHRLSVSYGLSFSIETYGNIFPPKDRMKKYFVTEKNGRIAIKLERDVKKIDKMIASKNVPYSYYDRISGFDYFEDYSSVKD